MTGWVKRLSRFAWMSFVKTMEGGSFNTILERGKQSLEIVVCKSICCKVLQCVFPIEGIKNW